MLTTKIIVVNPLNFCLSEGGEALSEAILKRVGQLTPDEAEASACKNLVTKVEAAVSALIKDKEGLTKEIDEIRVVGSYKKGTMLAGHPVADLVVIMKDTPTGKLFFFSSQNTIMLTSLSFHEVFKINNLLVAGVGFKELPIFHFLDLPNI